MTFMNAAALRPGGGGAVFGPFGYLSGGRDFRELNGPGPDCRAIQFSSGNGRGRCPRLQRTRLRQGVARLRRGKARLRQGVARLRRGKARIALPAVL